MLGVSLPKTDRLSDWIVRPITDRQIHAAGDVAYLLAFALSWQTNCSQLGRLEWAQEECAALLRGRRAPTLPEEAWWKVRDLRDWRGKSRGVAQDLTAWRERRAAGLNRPRRTILSDLAL